MARKSQSVPSLQISFKTDGCEKIGRDQKFAIEDEGKTAIFLNPEKAELCATRIDGCVVTEGIRADWVVSQSGVGHAIVEFKGHDLSHAYDQVCATSALWRNHRVKKGEALAALILCNRVPKAPKSVDLQLRFLKYHRGQLTVKSHYHGISFKLLNVLRAD